MAVGGGFEASLSRSPDVAEQWNLRLLVEPWEHVDLELGYLGTRGPRLDTTSIEAVGKWYPQTTRPLRYFALAGVGWRHLAAPIDDDVVTLPVGVGLTYSHGRWRADSRLTLRPTPRRDLHTIGVTAHLGVAF